MRSIRPAVCAAALAVLVAAGFTEPDRVLLHVEGETPVITPNGLLETSFSRPVTTIDALGDRVGSDQPRRDQPEAFFGVPQITQITSGDSGFVRPLAAGHTAFGDPLFVVERGNGIDRVLEFWASEPGGPIGKPPKGAVLDTFSRDDLFEGTIPGVKAVPEAAAVFQGAVLIMAEVEVGVPPEGRPDWVLGTASALFVANHDGTKIDDDGIRLVYCDSLLNLNSSADRIKRWSMSGAYVPTREENPNEVWFPVADYRRGMVSTGGVWILVRATREAVGEPWTFHPPCEMVRIEQDGFEQKRIRHAHTAGVAWDRKSGKMTAVLFGGDGSKHNCVYALSIDEPERYAENAIAYRPGWWTGDDLLVAFAEPPHVQWERRAGVTPAPSAWGDVNYRYHGATHWTPLPDDQPAAAYQPVGLSPGPTPNTIVCGADNHDGPGVAWIDVEESTVEAGARFQIDHLQLGNSGYGQTDGFGYITFDLRTTNPENPTIYTSSIRQNNVSGTYYRPHTIVGVPHESGLIWGKVANLNKDNVYSYGNTVYHAGLPPLDSGLLRLDLRDPVVGRPERVGPGGRSLQSVAALENADVSAGTAGEAVQVGRIELDALPQRPFNGPVFRLDKPYGTAGRTVLARYWPNADPINLRGEGLCWRLWILADPEVHQHGSPIRFEVLADTEEGEVIRFGEAMAISCNRWVPVDVYGKLEVEGPVVLRLRVLAAQVGDSNADVLTNAYVGVGSLRHGMEPVGYPYPLAENGLGTAAPSEIRSFTGFGDSPSGTLLIAGMVPWDGMDYGWWVRGYDREVPILSILNNQENHLQILWKGMEEIVARRTAGGWVVDPELPVLEEPIQRGDPFQIAIRWDKDSTIIDTWWAGYRSTQVVSSSAPGFASDAELRFAGPAANPAKARGMPLDLFGVAFWPERRSLAQLEHEVESLDYLRHPNCPADLTGDYAVDIDDVLEFLRAFSEQTVEADLAMPAGQFNIDDVLEFLQRFSVGCQ